MDKTDSIEAPDETRTLAEIAESWYESGRAKRFNTPAAVLPRFQSDGLTAKLESMQIEFRNSLAEIRNPTFDRFNELFTEFVKSLCLLAARENPSSSFPDSDAHGVFLMLWLPRWVRDQALKEWASCAPPGFKRRYSNPKELRKFSNDANTLVEQTLWQEGLRASAPQPTPEFKLSPTPALQSPQPPSEAPPQTDKLYFRWAPA